MTQEMMTSKAKVRFAVVITDGHVTGDPCGGIKVAAESAREKNITIFAVATSNVFEEIGLTEIANSPSSVYRSNYMAVDLTQPRTKIQYNTIDRIIETMVTHVHRHTH